MPSYRAFNCREQYVRCHWFDQKIFRTGLDRLHDGFDISYPETNTIGSVEPASCRRPCSSGPLSPGIRTSRRRQPDRLCRWVADPRIVRQTNISVPHIRLAVIAADSGLERNVVVDDVNHVRQHYFSHMENRKNLQLTRGGETIAYAGS